MKERCIICDVELFEGNSGLCEDCEVEQTEIALQEGLIGGEPGE